jgi:hypothetical protein
MEIHLFQVRIQISWKNVFELVLYLFYILIINHTFIIANRAIVTTRPFSLTCRVARMAE